MPPRSEEERRAVLRQERGPGPAYMLPPTVGYYQHDGTRMRNPAYSLGLKLGSRYLNQSPGPVYLIPKGMTAKGPDGAPAYSIQSRSDQKEFGTLTPGPAAYYPDINVNRRRPPAFPLSFRTRLIDRGQQSPGPIYLLPSCLGPRIPDKPAAGECTIKSRHYEVEKFSQSPGPIYDIGSPNIIKNTTGPVTIKGRWKDLQSQSCNAGPGTYNVDISSRKAYRQAPAFSMGIRHSEFAGNLMTTCDKIENAGMDRDC